MVEKGKKKEKIEGAPEVSEVPELKAENLFERSKQILDETIQEMAKAQEKRNKIKGKIPVQQVVTPLRDERVKQILDSKKKEYADYITEYQQQQEEEKYAIETARQQYSILFDALFKFLNPLLQKVHITPLTPEEVKKLSTAILNVSEAGIKSNIKKLEKTFEGISKLPHYINLFSSIWEILVPRLNEIKEIQRRRREAEF